MAKSHQCHGSMTAKHISGILALGIGTIRRLGNSRSFQITQRTRPTPIAFIPQPSTKISILNASASTSAAQIPAPCSPSLSPFLQLKWRRRIEPPHQSSYGQHGYGGSQSCLKEVSQRKAGAVAGRIGVWAVVLFVVISGFFGILRRVFFVANTREGHG